MRQAVIEIEEGALTLTVAEVGRKAIVVERCERSAIADLTPEALETQLRSIASKVSGVTGVHVALGDRRIQHFTVDVPRMENDDLRAFVVREAHRLASLPGGDDLVGNARRVRRLSGRRQRIAAVALAASVWEPLHHAFRGAGFEVLSMTSMEAAIASIVDRSQDVVAVLELSAGRARFVLCREQAPIQVRRFLLPGGETDDDDSMLVAQLAMEVPRTLDYLAEIGCPRPKALIVSHRVSITDESAALFLGDVDECIRYRPDLQLKRPEIEPGLATIGILRQLQRPRRRVACPPDEFALTMPRSSGRVLLAAGAVLTGLSATVASFTQMAPLERLGAERAEVAMEEQRLEQELSDLELQELESEADSPEQIRVGQVLKLRRPHSLMVSAVCNAVPQEVRLSEVRVDDQDRIALVGVVRGKSRLEALTTLSAFLARLRQVPFLEARGGEEVDVGDAENELKFSLYYTWRVS